MFAVLEVKLADDHSALREVVELAGPFVIAAAAIFAAVIAWRSAGTRLRKELEASNVRLERELAHDREVRRDEFRRDALDSALEQIEKVALQVRELEGKTQATEMTWAAAEEVLEDPKAENLVRQEAKAQKGRVSEELQLEVSRLSSELPELAARISRLKVRFGSDHPIPIAAEDLIKKWNAVRTSSAATAFVQKSRTPEAAKKMAAESEDAGKAYATLMVECEAWLE